MFSVKFGKERKPIPVPIQEEIAIATAIVELPGSSETGPKCTCVAQELDIPFATARKIPTEVIQFYARKCTFNSLFMYYTFYIQKRRLPPIAATFFLLLFHSSFPFTISKCTDSFRSDYSFKQQTVANRDTYFISIHSVLYFFNL